MSHKKGTVGTLKNLGRLNGLTVEVLRQSSVTGSLSVKIIGRGAGVYRAGVQLSIAPYEFLADAAAEHFIA